MKMMKKILFEINHHVLIIYITILLFGLLIFLSRMPKTMKRDVKRYHHSGLLKNNNQNENFAIYDTTKAFSTLPNKIEKQNKQQLDNTFTNTSEKVPDYIVVTTTQEDNSWKDILTYVIATIQGLLTIFLSVKSILNNKKNNNNPIRTV